MSSRSSAGGISARAARSDAIAVPGGSVEHWNEEAGQAWMERLLAHFPKAVWLNPVPPNHWGYTHSIGLIRALMHGRMFPLTLECIDQAMRELVR